MQNNNFKEHLYALIVAGGGGTRLWPRSRNKNPKQFLRLFQGRTLTQITAHRFSKILPWERIYVVTVSDGYKKEILREVPDLLKDNIIVEPERRETGPAHGLGATYIYKADPDSVIITDSADRIVEPMSRYLDTLLAAAEVSYTQRMLVAMGVKARYPNTGYGHIKKGKLVKNIKNIKFYNLEKFVEKPVLPLAVKYTNSGKYFWNAGQFVWRSDSLLESLKRHVPQISSGLKEIGEAIGTKEEKTTIKRVYKSMQKVSIDYAVAEKEKNFLVVEGEFYWTDIGDWNEVWQNLPKDKSNNVIIDGDEAGGRVINIDTNDTLIHLDGRLIAIVDVDDIAIIDTKEVLLVCKRSQAQSVKKIVEQLKKEKNFKLL